MSGRRIYREDVEIAQAGESVQQAARRMRERRVGTLVVVDDLRHPIGIITDRDLAVRVLGEERDPVIRSRESR
jgi:CBS domain-containing protein